MKNIYIPVVLLTVLALVFSASGASCPDERTYEVMLKAGLRCYYEKGESCSMKAVELQEMIHFYFSNPNIENADCTGLIGALMTKSGQALGNADYVKVLGNGIGNENTNKRCASCPTGFACNTANSDGSLKCTCIGPNGDGTYSNCYESGTGLTECTDVCPYQACRCYARACPSTLYTYIGQGQTCQGSSVPSQQTCPAAKCYGSSLLTCQWSATSGCECTGSPCGTAGCDSSANPNQCGSGTTPPVIDPSCNVNTLPTLATCQQACDCRYGCFCPASCNNIGLPVEQGQSCTGTTPPGPPSNQCPFPTCNCYAGPSCPAGRDYHSDNNYCSSANPQNTICCCEQSNPAQTCDDGTAVGSCSTKTAGNICKLVGNKPYLVQDSINCPTNLPIGSCTCTQDCVSSNQPGACGTMGGRRACQGGTCYCYTGSQNPYAGEDTDCGEGAQTCSDGTALNACSTVSPSMRCKIGLDNKPALQPDASCQGGGAKSCQYSSDCTNGDLCCKDIDGSGQCCPTAQCQWTSGHKKCQGGGEIGTCTLFAGHCGDGGCDMGGSADKDESISNGLCCCELDCAAQGTKCSGEGGQTCADGTPLNACSTTAINLGKMCQLDPENTPTLQYNDNCAPNGQDNSCRSPSTLRVVGDSMIFTPSPDSSKPIKTCMPLAVTGVCAQCEVLTGGWTPSTKAAIHLSMADCDVCAAFGVFQPTYGITETSSNEGGKACIESITFTTPGGLPVEASKNCKISANPKGGTDKVLQGTKTLTIAARTLKFDPEKPEMTKVTCEDGKEKEDPNKGAEATEATKKKYTVTSCDKIKFKSCVKEVGAEDEKRVEDIKVTLTFSKAKEGAQKTLECTVSVGDEDGCCEAEYSAPEVTTGEEEVTVDAKAESACSCYQTLEKKAVDTFKVKAFEIAATWGTPSLPTSMEASSTKDVSVCATKKDPMGCEKGFKGATVKLDGGLGDGSCEITDVEKGCCTLTATAPEATGTLNAVIATASKPKCYKDASTTPAKTVTITKPKAT